MNLKNIITFAVVTGIVLITGCSPNRAASNLPSITSSRTPFIRVTELVYDDLIFAALADRPTPTREAVAEVLKRERIVVTETLDKGDTYIPALVKRREIVTVNSGFEDWALIETALWDEQRHRAFMTAGFIPLHEYKSYLAQSRKAGQKK